MLEKKIMLVTGGLGFIGKHCVRAALDQGFFVINIDMVSYAADLKEKKVFEQHPNYRFIQQEIQSLEYLPECDFVFNFAAESHVDRAISSNKKFCLSNFMGVQNLLELVSLKQALERPLFLQISTDEVYGDIEHGSHTEDSPLRPSNPYSATKAAADLFIQSFGRTHGIPWRIIRLSNTYGFHQYPEKLIPKSAWRMRRGLPALMHGDGSYRRAWLHVDDAIDAVFHVALGATGHTIYNASGADEVSNIDILRMIAHRIGVPQDKAFISVEDRAGQDLRYGMNNSRIAALGWKPKKQLHEELPRIVECIEVDRFL
jgi:dTDP-glucose 4,6-dehydratase